MTDPQPLGLTVISSREIYDAVVRLTGRIDILVAQQEEVKTRQQDQEARIRVLEATVHEARLRVVEISDISVRVRALESARWPLPSLAILFGIGSLILGLINYLTK